MSRQELLPSLIFSAVLLILMVAGLVVGDPNGLCGEPTSGACLKAVGGPLSAAVLSLVLAYGQYVSGRRQAKAADLQARLAAVPLIENEIRGFQTLAIFIVRFRAQIEIVKRNIERLSDWDEQSRASSRYEIILRNIVEAFDETHKNAIRFFDELETLIIPDNAQEIQSGIIQIGSGFASGVGPAAFYMKQYVEHTDEPSRVSARANLGGEILDNAGKACTEALNLVEETSNKIALEVHRLREKRSNYLNNSF